MSSREAANYNNRFIVSKMNLNSFVKLGKVVAQEDVRAEIRKDRKFDLRMLLTLVLQIERAMT